MNLIIKAPNQILIQISNTIPFNLRFIDTQSNQILRGLNLFIITIRSEVSIN